MRDNISIRLSRTVKRKVIGARLGIAFAERYAVSPLARPATDGYYFMYQRMAV